MPCVAQGLRKKSLPQVTRPGAQMTWIKFLPGTMDSLHDTASGGLSPALTSWSLSGSSMPHYWDLIRVVGNRCNLVCPLLPDALWSHLFQRLPAIGLQEEKQRSNQRPMWGQTDIQTRNTKWENTEYVGQKNWGGKKRRRKEEKGPLQQ